MKNTKYFVIPGLLVLLFGICIFVFNTERTKKMDIKDGTIVHETEKPEYLTDGDFCFRMYASKITKTKDGALIDKYQENVFGCFCEKTKKAIEGFEFKTTDSNAGQNCKKQCAELCKNKK